MSDLFHARIPTAFIKDVFTVMADNPRHTFQLLTKRPKRMLTLADDLPWPVNIWAGVSVENPETAWRVRYLTQVPAAVRFISAEPLIAALPELELDGVDWMIVGGESGPRHRPLYVEWVRQLRVDRSRSCRHPVVDCR